MRKMRMDDPCCRMTGRYDCWLARDVAEPMSGYYGTSGICAVKESSTSCYGNKLHEYSIFLPFLPFVKTQKGFDSEVLRHALRVLWL
jgi:hypothetical protein